MLGQITLTHNIGNAPIETDMFSCERDEGWSRVFKLSDFGIAANEQFIINSGQVALSKSYEGARLQFSVYTINSDFPTFFHSLYPRTPLGTRGIGQSPAIDGAPEIIQVDFAEPIIVPAGVERILVTVRKLEDFYNPASAEVFIAGTEEDIGVSWYEGCDENYSLTPTTDLTNPVPNANFYINVTGDVFDVKSLGTTTRLSHNVCDDIIETNIHSCTSSYIYWAKAFTLEDFGISTNEEFIINSGQVGINKTGWLPEISFNIYKIDDNFPASFSESDLIGSSQYQQLSPNIDRSSQIIEVNFDTPIVIPADVERILVEVHKGIVYGDGVAFIAGSTQDNHVSWQRGCTNVAGGSTFDNDQYVSTADFGRPDANFYINVTGNVNHVTNNFEMNISNICSEFLKEFGIENQSNIFSVVWDFGDVASGADNTSTDLTPFHDFSTDGIYTIIATVTANNGSDEVLSETIDVKEPPNAYGINNVYGCEDNFNTGISSTFDVSMVEQQILGGQIDKIVTFIDASGNEYSSLPNPFTNTVRDIETISVRVSHKDNLCCYSETTFDLIVNPLPTVTNIAEQTSCEINTDGFASFDLSDIESIVLGGQIGMIVEFYDENGNKLPSALPNPFINSIPNQEIITVRVINNTTDCYNETTFTLNVNEVPIVNSLDTLIGCDDDNDGISEYFDTSSVENTVLGGQTGMQVSYYDSSGNFLSNTLQNPYTNITPYEEILTVRVTNTQTSCYVATPLVLKTSIKPQINTPQDIYACDEGNGISTFDLSAIETEIIGNQTGLNVYYFDAFGINLANLSSSSFYNTEPWSQTIYVKVENASNILCFSETSFSLIIDELPQVDIQESYFLCNLEPSLPILINANFDAWEWKYEDGSVISNSNEAILINAGNYELSITEFANGKACENTFNFELIRSVLPTITDVEYQELTDDNYIKINASGDGDFEFSIDGVNFQNSNYFDGLFGGIYDVYVRDIYGCGEDTQQITIVDYPKYFTPNGDRVNDNWQIKGIESYSNSEIYIYDRYGKLLKQLNPNSKGWDGTFNGNMLPSDDYWFKVLLNDGREFINHFTLKR